MMELILSIALVLNVFFAACVTAWLSKIHDRIGGIHHAEIVAHTSGWTDCLNLMDALKERVDDTKSEEYKRGYSDGYNQACEDERADRKEE